MSFRQETTERYVNSLRNRAKRLYAEQYARAKEYGDPPPPPPEDLSYMAAQAVRLEIDSHFGDEPEED